MRKTSAINLAKGRNGTFLDRFLNWALSVGRLLIVITEAIALAVFLSRFYLDRQIIDLHTRIKQEQAIVNAFANDEKTYRDLQNRLGIISQLEKQSPQSISLVKALYTNQPSDVKITHIALTKDVLKIDASFQSTSSLASFVKNLQQNNIIKTVSLDKIENKTATATIIAGMTATLKT